MNCCRETVEMAVPPGNRPAVPRDWIRGVLAQYVAGSDTRGRPEGRSYPRSQSRRGVMKYPGYDAVEKLNLLRVSTKSVIPESAAGGYPESRENNSLLDTGSRLRLVRYDV